MDMMPSVFKAEQTKAEFEIIEERMRISQKTEPFSIDGYYPLYYTEKEANKASPLRTSHTHILYGVTYYMPDGLGSEQYHGTYNPSLATDHQKAMGNTVLYLAQLYEQESLSQLQAQNPTLIEGSLGYELLGCVQAPVARQCNEVKDVSKNKIEELNVSKYFPNTPKPNVSKFIGYYVQKTSGMKLSWSYEYLAPYQVIYKWPTCWQTYPLGANVETTSNESAISSWATSLQLPDDKSISTEIGITFTGLNPTTKDSKDIQAMFPLSWRNISSRSSEWAYGLALCHII